MSRWVSVVHTTPHQYVSTACFHQMHHICRNTCKYCAEHCHCACHDLGEPHA